MSGMHLILLKDAQTVLGQLIRLQKDGHITAVYPESFDACQHWHEQAKRLHQDITTTLNEERYVSAHS